jgi:phosphoenolpyruvate synthase/pyruvate phosphate dikinase
MVNSACAGVLFTANMLTGSRQQMVIDATLGLGEQLVQGAVVPDHFVVDAKSGSVVERLLGEKKHALLCNDDGGTRLVSTAGNAAQVSSLSDEQIAALVTRGRHIVSIYDNTPMDVEWAIDNDGSMHIVQARPITSLFPVESVARQVRLPEGNVSAMLSFASIQGVPHALVPITISCWKTMMAHSASRFVVAPSSRDLMTS